MSVMNKHLMKALSCFDNSQTALARELGVSKQYVHKMLKAEQVPLSQCRNIERVTDGAVTAEQMRPDIFAPIDSAA